jgi:hypothetical protein
MRRMLDRPHPQVNRIRDGKTQPPPTRTEQGHSNFSATDKMRPASQFVKLAGLRKLRFRVKHCEEVSCDGHSCEIPH